ncbi:torsin-1A [Leptopilina boulardi]|uniref:torsin-1A n=1 Tax=Leptopilina boulardi TaxID=63433 RepID=UPI0021F63DAA|nr:torsin-1A [Leptopilina boulardi]
MNFLTFQVILTVFLILQIQNVIGILPLLSLGYAGAGLAGMYAGYSYLKCKVTECCNDEYIPADIWHLDSMLRKELFGQKIAHETVLNAIRGHLSHLHPIKPLAMSFHGLPGSGKNFVVKMIAKALFKNGEDSEYFHFFNGRDDFPNERDIDKYKADLRQELVKSIKKCDRSLFVFDEVDKMPEGVLNALVPILDYTSYFKLAGVNKNKAIFIFLSNTGSQQLVRRLLELWESGKNREDTSLQDFENLITIGAFNEKGGFHKSDTIETSLIDHYVPFLPLEESHVIKCVQRAFRERFIESTDEMVSEVMKHVTFDPPPHNLYSKAGCKRIEQKVDLIVNQKRRNFDL